MTTGKELPDIKTLVGKAISSAQQEMVLTLPDRLLLAFSTKSHERDIDPETGQPFTSFYRWLWVNPPPGCGLCSSQYLGAEDIIHLLERCRDRMPADMRGTINALIEELVKGHGAAKKRGGDRRSEKAKEEQKNGTGVLMTDSVRRRSSKASSLAARLAESADPKVRGAWQGFLEGKHRSVTAAAIACGMVEDANAPLPRLEQYWRKASKKERQAFLEWISKEGRKAPTGRDVLNALNALSTNEINALQRWLSGQAREGGNAAAAVGFLMVGATPIIQELKQWGQAHEYQMSPVAIRRLAVQLELLVEAMADQAGHQGAKGAGRKGRDKGK